jgi:hypothetical protein
MARAPAPPAPPRSPRPRSTPPAPNRFCTGCGRQLPAPGQPCPACNPPAPAPAPPPPPVPPVAPPVPPRRRAAAPAAPAPAQPPAVPHGTRQQYVHPVRTSVGRDENWVAHGFYVFLLWALVVGGLALLAWLVFGGYQWGWHANPCKPPCVSAPEAPSSGSAAPAGQQRPSPTRSATRPTRPPAPQQVQVSGSLDLVHHEGQQTQTATAPAVPARRPTLEELDEATARWLEGRDP